MRVIFFILLCPSVWAANPLPFKVEIQHPRSNLVLEWDGKRLEASDRVMQTSIELKKCNERMLNDFFEIDRTHWRNRPAKTPDSVRVKRNTESLIVSGQSVLGKYLLTLKDQLLLLKAQESVVCK